MESKKKHLPYNLGLDIGIASVGWAVLGEKHIIDLGVRIFDRAETTDGESLNKVRRNARLVRRRLRRRAWRLLKLARLLKQHGLIDDSKLFLKKTPITQSLWQLRVDGLNRLLSGEEWARVIYHICKHRGFWFARKNEAEDSEGGKVKQGLDRTRKLMESYRTAAEMMIAEFPRNQRNKRSDYSQSLARETLAEELKTLFAQQRQFGNPFTQESFETQILNKEHGLLWQQKPALSGQAMLNLIGKCTFESGEYRAPKQSWSAERFVWLTKLNNMRISVAGNIRPLTEQERLACLDLPYELSSVKFNQLKSKLVKSGYWSADVRFVGLSYRDDSKDPEAATLMELKGWHDIKKVLEKALLKSEWQYIAGQPTLLDQISFVLSVYKTNEEIRHELNQLQLSSQVIEALLSLSFKDFVRLSLKALRAILPGMERGLRYDQACDEVGYVHSMPNCILGDGDKQRLLPSFYTGRDKNGKMQRVEEQDLPNNPVVLRSLNQARLIVNAIIRRHGSPNAVHIEMARDLSRSLDERRKIEKEQKAFGDRNEKSRERFLKQFERKPTSREFEKWQLYAEQQGKCAYSLHPLDLGRLIDDATYAEVDHALPYSRSFDDSKNNKVLVLTKVNRDKGNQTPYEYLDGVSDSPRWQAFLAFTLQNKSYRQAKRDRLLRKSLSKEDASGFKERNLQDTRYACRYFKNFVEHHLALRSDSEIKRCVVVSGQLTSFLRTRWGLTKLRGVSDRHHAIDAAVVAACSQGMVKRLADYSRRRELQAVREGFIDMETGEILNPAMLNQLERHFPRPWEHFEHELCLRAGVDRSKGTVLDGLSIEQMREQLSSFGYDDIMLEKLRPLFVSRAPKRRNSGAAHKDTIYALRPTADKPNRVTQKVWLNELSMNDLDKLIDPHRNAALYEAIHERLRTYGGKADKAFSADNPFYKPTKDGRQGPLVRSVTLVIDKLSGIPVRGGVAKNDSMLRVDVFNKDGKFYLVPLYVHHRLIKIIDELPNRAIVQGKDEDDWTVIDDSFSFCFSVYPNDFLKITLKGKGATYGYYSGCDRATGGINLWVHDRNVNVGKEGLIRGVGVKTALQFEKFHVDELGVIYPAKPEVRRGVA